MKKTVILEKWKKSKAKIFSAIKKLEKSGIESTFRLISESDIRKEIRSVHVIIDNDDTLGSDVKVVKMSFNVLDIEIEGEIGQINGFEYSGTIDRLPNNDVLLSEHVPSSYSGFDTGICEHCNKLRKRNRLYVLKDELNGGHIAVGSSCVASFLGHTGAERLLELSSIVSVIDSRDKMDFNYGEKVVNTVEYIQKCAQLILDSNYANSSSESSTSMLASNTDIKISPEAIELANKSINRALNFSNSELDNNFNHNLNQIAKSEYIYCNQLGIAAYMCEMHRIKRSKEIVLEKSLDGVSNEHIGQIKARLELNLTYIKSDSFENNYGTTHFIKFSDDNGNLVTWKGSSKLSYVVNLAVKPDELFSDESLIGKKIKLVGTITRLDEFRGRKTTIINRCKIIEIIN